jgi:methyl-accepting chemotaxis protein
MKNWKIGKRITAGFAAVIVVAGALGLFAYTRVSAIERSATDITTDALPGITTLGQMQNNVHRSMALLLQNIILTDRGEIARVEADIADLRARGAALLKECEPSVVTDREKELFAAVKDSRTGYWAAFDEALALASAEKNSQAIEVVNRKLEPLYKRYAEAVDAQYAYN